MKQAKRSLSLLFAAAVVLSSAACGKKADNTVDQSALPENDVQVTSMSELDGMWSTDSGALLCFDSESSGYLYRACTGRIGRGPFELTDGVPTACFNGFPYRFLLRGGEILLPDGGPSAEGETLKGLAFRRDDLSDLVEWDLANYDGTWINAMGEMIRIDAAGKEYTAESGGAVQSGTIHDEGMGQGPYLLLNGHAYLCPAGDGNSFTLDFAASEDTEPDGSFRGVFYRDGDVERYADLAQSQFYYKTATGDILWYFDGVNEFYVGPDYTVAGDELAYDRDGNIYPAGWLPAYGEWENTFDAEEGSS